jgi:ribosomal protein S18 acetylase RimI-like enzyme
MTPGEFADLRSGLISGYAAEQVAAGRVGPDEAERRSAEEADRLLPAGVDTPAMLLMAAETPDGHPVGHLWLGLEREPGTGGDAWIYDIEIIPERRGQGYGRALLSAAEELAAQHGAVALGLNVFGGNQVARRLYESAGYQVSSLQMRKRLAGGG